MDRRFILLGGASAAAAWAASSTLRTIIGPPLGNQPGSAALKIQPSAYPSAGTAPLAATASGLPAARVIIVGGGMAGATLAKYLRLWGGAIDVTLIEKRPQYVSSIMSSLVLTGQRTLSSLNFSYNTLVSRYGVRRVQGEVRWIDPDGKKVTLVDGSSYAADKVIVAPGIDFDDMPGLLDPLAMPHAWQAGPQTTALANQLKALPAKGTVVMTIPLAPYRCPPGPYERSTLLADWLKRNKPGARLIVLDANPDIIVEKDNFRSAYDRLYPSIIDYRPSVVIDSVSQSSRTLHTNIGDVRGDVINLIRRQKAPTLLYENRLVNDQPNRFAKVNVLDYSSTAAPNVHVIGDSSSTTQPKAGHIANQEAKICADAIIRTFSGLKPDPAPVTSSACFSTITMREASWLHAVFAYDNATQTMKSVAAAGGASPGWNGNNFEDMSVWFKSLMADSFA